MEPAPPAPSRQRLGPASTGAGELVVHNGRQRGHRRPLNVPVTFVGRSESCDIRLNGDGISPLHCLLVHAPSGLEVRDLQSAGGTHVNGQPVLASALHDGDLLTVGPFEFQVRLPGGADAPANDEEPAEPAADGTAAAKEALRIQAAAVAAQQAALGDEEARLQQRRGALEQQEGQLAAHLEEKRRRLVQLGDQAQAARVALRKERAAYQESVEQTRRDLTETQKEVLEAREQAQAERKRLIELRRRLKRRWHRHWMAERRAFRRRENELLAARHQLEKEADRLRQEQADTAQLRLRCNGEVELARRQIQTARDELCREQAAWQEQHGAAQVELHRRSRALQRAEEDLALRERDLAYERHQWQGLRLLLEREAEGLDARVANQRRKIAEQQAEIVRLDAGLRALRPPGLLTLPVLVPVSIVPTPPDEAAPGTSPTPPVVETTASGAADPAPAAEAVPSAASTGSLTCMLAGGTPDISPPEHEPLASREAQLVTAETALQRRVRTLERLAGELADQRFQLAEGWQRLAQTQHRWQQDRDAAAAELEALAARLPEQERAVAAYEARLETVACDIRRQYAELVHQRQHLDGWQARLRAREATWEAERDRLIADVRVREEATEQTRAALEKLRQRWSKRHSQEAAQLRAERAAAERLRKEWATLRQEWWRRNTALGEQRRALAEKELALERYRQDYLAGTEDAAAAERGVERLRRRWAKLKAATVRATSEGRQKLQDEAVQLEAHYAVLQKQGETLAQRERSLVELQTTVEHRETLARAQEVRTHKEVQQLRAQRDFYEKEARELRDEVERISRQLLNEPDDILPALGHAA
jgi:chromosome segregation ATPase